jgi:hypothetical protein
MDAALPPRVRCGRWWDWERKERKIWEVIWPTARRPQEAEDEKSTGQINDRVPRTAAD